MFILRKKKMFFCKIICVFYRKWYIKSDLQMRNYQACFRRDRILRSFFYYDFFPIPKQPHFLHGTIRLATVSLLAQKIIQIR